MAAAVASGNREPEIEIDAAAEILHQSAEWVRRKAKAGQLPGRLIGRTWLFRESELRLWLDARANSAAIKLAGLR